MKTHSAAVICQATLDFTNEKNFHALQESPFSTAAGPPSWSQIFRSMLFRKKTLTVNGLPPFALPETAQGHKAPKQREWNTLNEGRELRRKGMSMIHLPVSMEICKILCRLSTEDN